MNSPASNGEEILSATIIVGEPNPLLDGIHDRMPVMLEDYDRWLDPEMAIEASRAVLNPFDPALVKIVRSQAAVNSVKNDTPECVELHESTS